MQYRNYTCPNCCENALRTDWNVPWAPGAPHRAPPPIRHSNCCRNWHLYRKCIEIKQKIHLALSSHRANGELGIFCVNGLHFCFIINKIHTITIIYYDYYNILLSLIRFILRSYKYAWSVQSILSEKTLQPTVITWVFVTWGNI